MYCEKCGTELPDKAKFCGKCGAAQDSAGQAYAVPAKKKGKKLFLLIIIVLAAVFAPKVMDQLMPEPAAAKSDSQWGKERDRDADDESDENEETEAEIEVSQPTLAKTFLTETTAGTYAATAPVESSPPVVTPDMVQWMFLETPVNLAGYQKMNILQSRSSSTIIQEGYQNGPEMAVDGDEVTSWQEGVDGSGIGESVYYTFDNKYNLAFITLKLGNWRNDRYFLENNRPKEMTISVNDYSFQVPFPDEKHEFVLALNPAYATEFVHFQIDGVHRGTKYDDTCIAEIGFYGILTD